MKGGFNKLLRNIVASTADTEYKTVSRHFPTIQAEIALLLTNILMAIIETYKSDISS